MKIKDLTPNMKGVEIMARITEISPVKEFTKFGKPGKVASAVIEDETGKVMLTLWDEQTSQVKTGDRVKITNGYIKEWQGEMQLSVGRFGKLEIQ